LVVYRSIDDSGSPVARNGLAEVNVSTINGDINQGDYITSSPLAGKGEKAISSGYVVGIALQKFTTKDGSITNYNGREVALGKIQVALRIEYAEITTSRSPIRLLEYLNAAIFKNIQNPEKFIQIIRYLGAGIIIITA